MNLLRKFTGQPDPLESRLDRLIGQRPSLPSWQTRVINLVHHPGVELYRDARDIIRHVRIGPWRVIAASNSRHIAEVRDLACNRVAVRIEREDEANHRPYCTSWELYDLNGHLLAMLQHVPEKNTWLCKNFEADSLP